jgi:ABC-type uncharacterized transport system substrate-binding protein
VAPDFKETLQVARIAALANAGNPAVAIGRKEIDTAARKLGMELQLLEVRTSEEIGPAFDAASRQNADALIVQLDGLMQVNRKLFVELAVKHRLPAVYGAREFVDAGGLMFYGVSYANLFRRAATYVDRILKGTRPADLPVEQPTKFELVINLKTANALPRSVPSDPAHAQKGYLKPPTSNQRPLAQSSGPTFLHEVGAEHSIECRSTIAPRLHVRRHQLAINRAPPVNPDDV